jgi:long-chain fatty acid transport protein
MMPRIPRSFFSRIPYDLGGFTLRPFTKQLLLVCVAMLATAGAAFGSGYSIFEQGAKATAMAGAFTALADDPSAIFYNVAGIAQLRRTEFYGGGTAINFSNQFTGDPNDPFTVGTSGQYRRHTFVPPNAYFVMPIRDNLTIGVGLMTPFGLRTNWQEPFAGRFVSRDANIKTVSVEPSVAWQTGDGRLALGFGAEYRRAHVILSRNAGAFNPFNARFSDVATTYLASKWEHSWGWSAGVLFKPGDWRLGLSYRAPMTIDFKGTATVTQIPSGNPIFDASVAAGLPRTQGVTTAVEFPSTAAIGVAYAGIPNWVIEGDVTHTTWSRFKALTVNFDEQPAFSFTRPQNWTNSDSFRLGANHVVTSSWDVRFGAYYDQTPQPTEVVSPLLPDADRIGVSLGVGYHGGPFVVDVTEFALHFKKRSTQGISSDNFNGTYKTNANLIAVNLGYRF